MDDSKNNHHHHHHHQNHVVGSSSSSSSSYYGVGTTTHAWSTTTTTPTSFMNTNNGLNSYPSEPVLSLRDEHTLLSSQYNPDMDLAFHNWAYASQSVQDHLQLPRIKEEFSDHYYRKYTDLLNESEQNKALQASDFGTCRLLLKSLSPESLMNKNAAGQMISPGDNWLYSNSGGANYGRGYGQVFPSMNVSSLNHQMEMNSEEALDLLTSSSFSGNSGTSSQNYNQIGVLRDHGFSNYGAFDVHTQQSHQFPLFDTDKISAPMNHGSVEPKRSSNNIEPKATPPQNATKKSRLEARGSCPPFKVRKEKLGDRIAALQQLVAPFGKTDTASVLMEAIGYIKFLQDQVETLSVPYMKASRNNKSNRAIQEGLVIHQNETDGEPRRDLKSRGLCLVPVSCLSYITDGGSAVVWPPPHFGGPT